MFVMSKVIEFNDLNIIGKTIQVGWIERTIIAWLQSFHFLIVIWIEYNYYNTHRLNWCSHGSVNCLLYVIDISIREYHEDLILLICSIYLRSFGSIHNSFNHAWEICWSTSLDFLENIFVGFLKFLDSFYFWLEDISCESEAVRCIMSRAYFCSKSVSSYPLGRIIILHYIDNRLYRLQILFLSLTIPYLLIRCGLHIDILIC